ncbi:hypothetical protein [Winogradskyella ursingii]|uniref:hypothetical protein n=1 Tax=Winogradskyella ursingii TaxID=2686079 RepID=UPI0015CB77FE|nr:hypothetical protein [Winogradskyella ursingii]
MTHKLLAKKKSRYIVVFALTTLMIFLFNFNNLYAQEKKDYLSQKFTEYSSLPREITYAHLNKSTLIKGEMLGYSIYVFDKFDKGPSTGTTNMYCVIKDSTDAIIKKKLIMMEKGVAHNVFNIDSTFTSGTYKFSAYTNYMLNFNEPNHFETEFTVIDPQVESEIENKAIENTYTIQILPEGGHMVAEVQNTVAIIVKDQTGSGLQNVKGKIVDDENNILSEFNLDQAGIAKTILTPKRNKNYTVIIPEISEQKDLTQAIDSIDSYGITMSLAELRDRIILTFRTNEATLPRVTGKNYKLTLHNGSNLNQTIFKFQDQVEVNQLINKDLLFPGINVLTVFDANNNPILERLYFNRNGVATTSFNKPSKIKRSLDSLEIELQLGTKLDTNKIQNISISVLPSETKSYNFESNLLSKLYLEPYVKGYIENAAYYFSNNTSKVNYDLDNLLISQGWSRYEWHNIFNTPPIVRHTFEFGITSVANVNDKTKAGTYVSSPLKNNTSEIFILSEEDKAFIQKGLFPLEDETYNVIKSGDEVTKKPSLYVTFSPSKFPEYTLSYRNSNYRNQNSVPFIATNDSIINTSWNSKDVEKLDEVLIVANKEKTRIEAIESQHFGTVDVIDDRTRDGAMTMAMYLTGKGYKVDETLGQLTVTVRNPATPNNNIPVIYLDGVRLSDFNVLANFRMSFVDYVVIDKVGATEGVRGANGVIKIFTDPTRDIKLQKRNIISEYEFPLTFSSAKKYYTPNYSLYNTPFFRDYGIISWSPDLKISPNRVLSFKVFNTNTSSINLYIEGVVNDKTFISQTQTLDLNN